MSVEAYQLHWQEGTRRFDALGDAETAVRNQRPAFAEVESKMGILGGNSGPCRMAVCWLKHDHREYLNSPNF